MFGLLLLVGWYTKTHPVLPTSYCELSWPPSISLACGRWGHG